MPKLVTNSFSLHSLSLSLIKVCKVCYFFLFNQLLVLVYCKNGFANFFYLYMIPMVFCDFIADSKSFISLSEIEKIRKY